LERRRKAILYRETEHNKNIVDKKRNCFFFFLSFITPLSLPLSCFFLPPSQAPANKMAPSSADDVESKAAQDPLPSSSFYAQA
jgi:hypothetical protein